MSNSMSSQTVNFIECCNYRRCKKLPASYLWEYAYVFFTEETRLAKNLGTIRNTVVIIIGC
jgi:hypothetical protein